MNNRFASAIVLLLLHSPALYAQATSSAADSPVYRSDLTREEILSLSLRPYSGQASSRPVNSIRDTVMCGYQGWFTCPGDAANRGWHHWAGRRGQFAPGNCSIDLWPDVSELPAKERYATEFKLADGSAAEVYSPLNAATVARHFQWMQEHAIDGVYCQRFAAEIRGNAGLFHFNTVLANCRAGANEHNRAWAVMYDLSGLGRGETQIVIDDWKQLVDRMYVGRDPADKAYLQHGGKPVLAVWGIGFNDGRRYSLTECGELIDFLKHDPKYGGNTVMIGVPSYWREQIRDCVDDAQLHAVIKRADIVSPWSVGRYARTRDVETYAREVWRPDVTWCRENQLEYLPVVFPGFSWHNMNPRSPLGQIPRRRGEFLWEQFTAVQESGATMAYVAMFDEVDEATAIFKCTNSPPVGESQFLDYEGLPSDHYLWLVGEGGKLIRGERAAADGVPQRE